MDWKKVVGIVLAAVLAVAGSILAYDFKADICGQPAPAVVAE